MRLPSNLINFTFYLTEECNIRCAYCFQKRRKRRLELSSIQKALEFFQDDFQDGCYISFYGGEPLLAFDAIRATIAPIENNPILKRKHFRYSISTNGTLLDDDMLRFLNDHRFQVNLSHDGTAQDITRPSGMNSFILEAMDRLIRLPGIEFSTNSVFVPATVSDLYRSARFLVDRGVRNCQLTHSIIHSWDSEALKRLREELRELREYLLAYNRRYHAIPVENFRNPLTPGLFACAAGQDRLALAADGRLWGCRFFADFFADREGLPEFDDYCFGHIQEFIAGCADVYPLKSRNYAELRMDNFSSGEQECRKCPRLPICDVCPATAAYSTGTIGKIPPWRCEMKKIWQEEIAHFWEGAKRY
jgi:uncharacterized protein